MEPFFLATVLIVTLVMGAENKPREDHALPANTLPASEVQSVDRKHAVNLCDSNHRHITQRDLTAPLDSQIHNDER
ncbi:MAG: hypothetical protein GYB33_08190 [Gammaproteobacteria bacterium]|nr:hypothetical protein [Gammaproteobacteria bacterium]